MMNTLHQFLLLLTQALGRPSEGKKTFKTLYAPEDVAQQELHRRKHDMVLA